MKINWKLVIKLTVIGSILFTYISTLFYQKEMAVTTMGEFTKEEAIRMKLDTQVYKGWPNVIYWGGFEIPSDVGSFLDFAGYIPAYMIYFTVVLISIVPNLLFWSLASFVLMIIYYSALRLLKR